MINFRYTYLSVSIIVIVVGLFFGCSNPNNIADIAEGGNTEGGNTEEDTTPTTYAVTFVSAVQTGGTSGTADSTGLTLTFSIDPTTLAASDITVTGATKGALSGTGTTKSIAISDITVGNGEEVTVTIADPSGFTISGSPQTAVVYRAPYIGMDYQGGKVAYILQSGDPGYVADETHGLIVATEDQDDGTGIVWAITEHQTKTVPDGTETALGTGSVNTENIITQNGAGITYAAGLAESHDGGGYSDWYLPSLEELNKLYSNADVIGGFATSDYPYYWSSSENGSHGAHCLVFSSGNEEGDNKSVKMRVRAVRSF